MRLFIALFLCLNLNYNSFSQKVLIDTLTYTTYNNLVLEFDYYHTESTNQKPTIVFVHGGSFMHGNKNLPYIASYANEWVKSGYNFAAINYRLTLKGKSFHCNCPSSEKIKTFEHSAYDIRAISKYLIDNYNKLGIDTSKIILSGNSAGAEAVLHTAYWDNNKHNIDKQLLSNNFKYAGVLATAGAIIDTNLITKKNAIPTAIFHGTCDKYVPYKTATHHYCPSNTPGALILSGSYDIMQRLKNLDKSYYMYTLYKGKHKVNTLGMILEIKETIEFVNKTILKKEKVQIHKVEKSSKEKCNFVEINFCE